MSSPKHPETLPRLTFDRFQIIEELGAGAQGRVVRAFDVQTRREVALKLLRLQSTEALSRFKNEFRILAGLVHPNLVRLGELFESESVWGFSMELVSGGDFLTWVRHEERGFDERRLRESLRQVASGLDALHGAGLIHRDLKPGNLRATTTGRIVVIDFGLATARGPSARTTQKKIVGTVGYMAPELLAGELATEQSDLYALGVVLYEALTGSLPFGDAHPLRLATLLQTEPVPAPSRLASGVPADLERLCLALLSREPAQRPSATRLLSQLTSATAPPSVLPIEPRVRLERFVGREPELRRVEQTLTAPRGLGLCAVLIHGESGIGKSALVEQALHRARRRVPEAILLSGRCHAAEHVPYNAFDDIVDGLARLLTGLPSWKRELVLPGSSYLLANLFPALAAIPGLATPPDAQRAWELDRAQLFDAFIDLLARVSQSFPLVLTLDDLQWADPDSMRLLEAMFARASDQNTKLILIARPEALSDAEGALARLRRDPRVATIELLPLDDASARKLAENWLPRGEPLHPLLREAAGSPLFLIELARAPTDAQAATLDAILRARINRLAPAHQRVLELVCTAAAPLTAGVLISALDISVEELYGALSVLRHERLLSETAGGELISYHDRIRQAVVDALDVVTRAGLHCALARTFEQPPFRSAGRAAQHWLLAGEERNAAAPLEDAAEHAHQNAAFELAAELYRARLALVAAPLSAARRLATRVRLAEALAAAGHCSASAQALLEALEGAEPETRRDLRLRAAQQLLQAGELAPGMRAAADAVRDVDLPWSASVAEAVLRLGVHRLKVRALRAGLRAKPQPPSALIDLQLDSLVRLIHPLAWSDSLRSAEISAHALSIALSQRRSEHLPMLLAAEAVQLALREPGSDEAEHLLGEARGRLQARGTREDAYCWWARGATAIANTRYAQAKEPLLRADELYRTSCLGEAWMHVNTRGMLLNAWIGGGEHREFVEHSERWMREAQAKGDAYALAYFSVGGQAAFRHVLADAPERALDEIEAVMKPWQQSWGLHHFLRLKIRHDVLSYIGGDAAHRWWRDTARVGRFAPAFFAEGFAWRRAEATLRAGIAQGSPALVRRAQTELHPLARAATLYVRVFAALTGMQIALLQDRPREGLRCAHAIRALLPQQDDYRVRVFELLERALVQRELPRAHQLAPLKDWFADAGWKNPTRAVEWTLPLAAWPREAPVR